MRGNHSYIPTPAHPCASSCAAPQAVDEGMLKTLEAQGVAPLQMIKLRKLIAERRGDAGVGAAATLPKPTRPMSARMQQAAAAGRGATQAQAVSGHRP